MSAPPPTQAPAIALHGFGLACGRPGREHVMLEGVDLVVPRGGLYLLVGASGAGTSTLLRFLTGLWELREPAPRVRGRAEVLGHRITSGHPAALRRRVAAVLQDEGLLDELSVPANVELALQAAGRSRKLASGLLSQAGLDDAPRSVAQLSGGMRKRAAVARALALEPELMLFDEPTAGLDAEAAREIAALIAQTHRGALSGRTTIVITHVREAFAAVADREIVLDAARRTLAFADVVPPAAAAAAPSTSPPPGAEADVALLGIGRVLLGVAALGQTLLESLLRLPPVHLGIVARHVGRFVLEPLLFTVLAGVAIGGLSTFFSLANNPLESAFTSQLLTGVGKVLVAVLVPLLAGFFFTARMAAGAAARIGTMKRTNQIAALQLMGVRPADYLLTPLVWAMCIAMPAVTAAGVVGAALSSFAVYKAITGATTYGWVASFFRTVDRADLRYVLLKAVVAGFLVAALTYHQATGPKRSGHEVGNAVNACIVLGMVTVLLVHSVLAIAQFA